MATTNEFPIGIRVLAIDNDPICLKLLEDLLIRCQYHVVATAQASSGLGMLRESIHEFDLVIIDIHMSDMDGFMLLQIITREFGIPVIISSADGARQTVAKAVVHGACQYLLKPVRMQELRNIWQHVLRKKLVDGKLNNDRQDFEENNVLADSECSSHPNDFSENVAGENFLEVGDSRCGKRPRISWTLELHQKFLAAINELGIDKAVPKKILDLMNVENLTREKVASHLQKYRQYVRRLKELTDRSSVNPGLCFRNLSQMKSDSLDVFRRYHAVGRMRILPPLASFPTNPVTGVNMLSGAAALGHRPDHFGSYQSFGFATNNCCRPNSLRGVPTPPFDHQLGELQQQASPEVQSGLLGGNSAPDGCLSWLQGNKPQMADGEVVGGDRSSATMTDLLCEEDSFDFEIDFPELDRCEAWQNGDGDPTSEHLASALPGFASSSYGNQAASTMDEAAQSSENGDCEDSATKAPV